MTASLRLQGVFLVTNDIDAQATFYEAILGLPLKFRDGQRWVQYDAGGARFALSNRAEAQPASNGMIPVYEVDSFDGIEAQVTQHGGQALGLRDMGDHGAVLSLRDPEGNVFQMFRRASLRSTGPQPS
ncbi:VOC family protein [Bordetella genomosp. 4]|uniref:VOC family protein n=1 Tax=Bordetella genomosp. 4 TaxID=463044 RepID=UPI000B9E89E1|nr:VOC family protein [Bordetella genomosp. 4]OZI43231.1 glyoxalase [Bordetella genomosp. 4]